MQRVQGDAAPGDRVRSGRGVTAADAAPRSQPPGGETDQGRAVLIRDAVVVTLDAERRVLDPGDVVLEGGAITFVGPADPTAAHRARAYARVIDGSRSVVIPGLVNAHTHTYATLFKGSYERMPLDLWLVAMRSPTRALSEELLELSTTVAAVEMLRTGTTTALDHFFGNPALPEAGIGAEIRAMRRIGLRHAVAFVVMDLPWDETLPLDTSAPGASEAAADVTRRETAQPVEAAEAFIAEYHGRHPLTTCLIGPSAAHRCSDELLGRARELADRTGVGIHLHLAEAKSHAIRNRDRWGESLVGRLDRIGLLGPDVSMAHGVWLADDELDILARTGATIVHNPASNLKLGSGVARVRDMIARGVHVAIATDGPCSSDNFNMFEALRLTGLLHTSNQVDYRDWLTARDIVPLATTAGARAANLMHVGSIEAGQRADLVMLSRDSVHWAAWNDPFIQLVYCENGSSVDRVFVDGVERVTYGEVNGIDEIALYREVSAARKSLEAAVERGRATVAPLEGPIHAMWRTLAEPEVDGMAPGMAFR